MQVTELTSPTRLSRQHSPTKLVHEIVGALVPVQLARSLLLPLLIFWVAATIALAFDRGYEVELVGLLVLLASRAAHRAGLRRSDQGE